MDQPTYRIQLGHGVSVLVGVRELRDHIGPERFDAGARAAAEEALAMALDTLHVDADAEAAEVADDEAGS